ncbi:hypothetical protein [Nocardia arizonensis]|uniref:hypothetical protein n=1 Tax=Nocardia arizonensis TaxID=1141647 RepID=UPI0012E2F01E|nr:hypothetical protein [Nocardia arizonensis]
MQSSVPGLGVEVGREFDRGDEGVAQGFPELVDLAAPVEDRGMMASFTIVATVLVTGTAVSASAVVRNAYALLRRRMGGERRRRRCSQRFHFGFECCISIDFGGRHVCRRAAAR